MSLIHIYLDKECLSNNEYINILKDQNIDFMQTNIQNTEDSLMNYDLERIPAIRFKDEILYEITEDFVNEIINKFNSFISNLPKINIDTSINPIYLKKLSGKDYENLFKKTYANNIRTKNKQSLSSAIKNFSKNRT